jgi:hypothetical protein
MRRSIPYVAAVGVAAVAVAVLAIDSSASRGVNGCVRDRIDLAGLGKSSSLVAVDATAPDDVWAVGVRGAVGRPVPVAERYDGHDWREVPVAALKRGGLLDVDAVSPVNVWATASPDGTRPLLLHWNGNRWRRIALPKRVYYVGKLAAVGKDVWVDGGAEPPDPDRFPFSVILRWDGRSWRSYQRGSALRLVGGLTFSSRHEGWVVGSYDYDISVSYVARWNGRSWKRVRVPSAVLGDTGKRGGESLQGVASTGAGNVWAVGGASSSGFSGYFTLNWNGKQWRLERDPGGAPFQAAAMDGAISIGAAKQGDIWLVAGEDAAARNTAGTWSPLPDPMSDVYLHAVSGVGRGEAWAVGERGAASSEGDASTAVVEHLDCRS